MQWCSPKPNDFKGLCLLDQDRQYLRAGETWIVAIGDPEHTWISDTFVTACKHAQETNYERLYFECYCL